MVARAPYGRRMDDTQIRHAVDMLDLVTTKVDLRSAGERFHVGLCPFHDEVEPSFVVDSTFGTYYCFGCRTSGDCFDWAWEMEGINRAGAREWLTERYGAPAESDRGAETVRATSVADQGPGESLGALVHEIMPRLAMRRPVFPSEADFQLALAWEIQLGRPDAQIRLEKRVADNPRIVLDLLVALGDHRVALELKYPKRYIDVEVDGERFVLPTGASDVERYDIWRDVSRLERLCDEETIDEGCALVLTNAPAFWSPPTRPTPTGYDAFRVHEGREVSGALDWGPSAGAGTRAGRSEPLTLRGKCRLGWRPFSRVVATAELRYLAIMVTSHGCLAAKRACVST